MLKSAIYASQITNLTDARYFAARGVEYLGFNLNPGTENVVSPQQVNAIKEWVEGPVIIGIFDLQDAQDILQAVTYLDLQAIQIGMFADTEAISKVVSIPIFKEIVVENEDLSGVAELIDSQQKMVEVFILDFVKNGLPWESLPGSTKEQLVELCKKNKVLFNLQLSLKELSVFIEQIDPYGLILLGDEEEKVGYKSYDELDDILDFLEEEE